ncbi:MAG TPA: hypothetical protein VG820_03460, partial [Fimbriimonadaceae bacterium]|nr:hypothetical protein [Fimbriimonadaceae bacterium]
WIDPAGSKNQRNGGLDYQNQYPIAFTTVTASGIPDFDSSSSILSLPLNITASDLNYLHGQTYGAIGLQAMDRIRPPGGQNINSLPLEYQFFRYLPAAVVGDKPTIAVARLGQGAVAVTSEGASLLLNRVAGGTFFPAANQFPYSVPIFGRATNTSYTAQPPVLENDAIAAAKLGINIISLASDYGQDGGGPRKTNSNAIDVTAPVLPNFSDESADGASTDSPPVSYKGVIVKSGKAPDGTYRIWVYDAIPGRDLDHDGDPDDGIVGPDTSTRTGTVNNAFRDLSIGKPYDPIWESVPVNGPVSAPTCAEVGDAQTNNYGIPKDQVLVVDGTGKLIGFDLFMRTRHGQLVGGPPSIYPHKYAFACNPPSGMGAIPAIPHGEVPTAPTVSDDLAFISVKQDSKQDSNGPVGAIWVADLTRGIKIASDNTGSGMQWYVGGTNAQGQHYPGYTASPTVGYIPIQDNSGGYDKVVYTPGLDDRGHPCFNSVWLGAKGENPFTWDISGDDLTVTTRAASQGNLSIYAPDRKETPPPGDPARWNLLPKLTLLDANGNPLPPSVA